MFTLATIPPSSSEPDSRPAPFNTTLESVAEANAYAAELLVDLELTRERLEEQNRALEQARLQAEESARCKSVFLATMSHELRTPLNAIIGYAEMLNEDARDQGLVEMAKDLDKIRAAGRHLLGVINDVLDFSKIDAGRMTVRMEPVQVLPVLEEVCAVAAPLARGNGNRVTIECEDGSLRVLADRLRLSQCLLNLLSNAARFTSGGEIRITAKRTASGGTGIAVRDTGIGMTPDFLSRLFEPFTQAEDTEVRTRNGTGLGLAISRRLARLMNGDLTVESAPGAGSAFTLQLQTAEPLSRP